MSIITGTEVAMPLWVSPFGAHLELVVSKVVNGRIHWLFPLCIASFFHQKEARPQLVHRGVHSGCQKQNILPASRYDTYLQGNSTAGFGGDEPALCSR